MGKESENFFELAVVELENALKSLPGDYFTIVQYGNTLANWAATKVSSEEKHSLFQKACSKYELAR